MYALLSGKIALSRPLAWAFLGAWCALIFALSSQPHLGTNLGTLDVVLRKFAHFIEYGILALLAVNAFSRSNKAFFARFREIRAAPRLQIAAVAFAIAYAASDEWHQTFVDGRAGSPIDVGIDAFGAITAMLMVRYARREAADRTERNER